MLGFDKNLLYSMIFMSDKAERESNLEECLKHSLQRAFIPIVGYNMHLISRIDPL